MSVNVNVLVNGRNCKQYTHQGKTFIESKNGSEYEIEIQNNNWHRVLAVVSVDGLSVMDGKTATNDNSGYIINANDNLKIKGYRYSNNDVGAFKFTKKENSYASSKSDGSEKNCGVIGVKIYDELVVPKTTTVIIKEPVYYPWLYPNYPVWDNNTWYASYWSTGSCLSNTTNVVLGSTLDTTDYNSINNLYENKRYGCSTSSPLRSLSSNSGEKMVSSCLSYKCSNDYTKDEQTPNFDMGTDWGTKKESKVVSVKFERGCLIYSKDIYYASRDSLIDMGVPLVKYQEIGTWPQSFPNEYATPPSGWRG